MCGYKLSLNKHDPTLFKWEVDQRRGSNSRSSTPKLWTVPKVLLGYNLIIKPLFLFPLHLCFLACHYKFGFWLHESSDACHCSIF